MTNWRLLEAEIVDTMRGQGHQIDESGSTGDKWLVDWDGAAVLNLTIFAQALADRVTLNTQAVAVKSEPANEGTKP